MIVVKEPAEPSAASDRACWRAGRFWGDQSVLEPLVIPLAVVVHHELTERPA